MITRVEELERANGHVGHLRANRNPKNPFIASSVAGVDYLDIAQYDSQLKGASDKIAEVISLGGQVLFVATKKHIAEVVAKFALEIGMPAVSTRWLGGTLTNFNTIRKQVNSYERLELKVRSSLEKGDEAGLSKKEVAEMQTNLKKLANKFDGIRRMKDLPKLIVIIDPNLEKTALKEANTMKIPVIATCDTNTSGDGIDFPIPLNDDHPDTIRLLLNDIGLAVKEGLKALALSRTQVKK